ncbi:MAG: hypothetical protein Ta2B_28470 [Termitinemataceae bacterium]|nr:MAG: hypothetical protein Ta2B_28470 [Termitinemataceae bacterium]
MKKIEILYEDDSCLVFDKPYGLAVQGGQNIKQSLDSIMSAEYQTLGLSERPLLVHRLDKDTSGVLLLAKTPQYAAYYSKIIFQKETQKIYRAICLATHCGSLKNDGEISSVIEINGVKKNAQTYYKVLKTTTDFSLLELRLGTGRMHQIRRHLAANKSPIIGDDKYGDFKLNRKLRKECGVKRLMLHAYRLAFNNPFDVFVDICSPLPPDFDLFCRQI